ncbi:MAG: S8 family serine peptidase [Candidatus Acidiferrales bacterium]
MRITDKGEVQVYIEMNAITPQNLDELHSYGVTVQIIGEPKPDKSKGEVLTRVPTVQGLLPLTMINQVSALFFVRYIRLPDYGFRNTGAVESQGDAILQAEAARSQFGVDGTGIRVGVMSDGIGGVFATGCTTCGPTSATPSPINTGDLPSATGTRNSSGILTSVSGEITAQSFRADGNLEACNGTCDTSGLVGAEGTAMLEIVHDLAPAAKLYFANFDTSLSFEQAVNWLATNTDVSVDDISWQTPPYDGTSAISTNTATALNTDANPIRGYFTAVANQTFNHWAEPWTDSGKSFTLGCPTGGITETGDVQLFQATANTKDASGLGPYLANPFPVAMPNGTSIQVVVTWNDPISGSSNDYDVFLYSIQSGNLIAPLQCSVNPQTGTQPPIESLTYTNNSGATQEVGILIQNVNNAAAARNFDMFVSGYMGNQQAMNFYTASGSVPAESDAGGSPVSVVSVGAIDQQQCTQSGACTGSVEAYSSQGPTEATPQAQARMKPDVTATDDVSVTGAGGFGINGPNESNTGGCAVGETPCYFAGTSAAAPHVAAIAALTLQAAPCLLSSSNVNQPATARANLRNFITGTAVPLSGIAQAAPNNIEGFGLVNALAAITAALPKPNAGPPQTVNAASATGANVSFSGSATDPDSCPVTLNWTGSCGNASGATASLMCPVGNDTETLTASNGGVVASLPKSTVQVTVSDFSVAPSPSTQTVNAGKSATYTITVAQQFGAFTNPVSLACSGLPSLASCSFSSSTATPDSGSATSTLTITTTAASLIFPVGPSNRPSIPILAAWVGLLLMLTVAAFWAKRSRRKLTFGFVSCALLACFLSAIASCSNANSKGPSSPGTPAGTYTVSVTGSSNQLQHSTNVTLTVQ